MTDLKLTTGYWKMRNGGKVKLVHREEGVRYPWVGYQGATWVATCATTAKDTAQRASHRCK
jgi:hypothetical protein